MDINRVLKDDELILALGGRLDTTTAPHLEELVEEKFFPERNVVLDLKDLEYISSAGLRVLLMIQKKANESGKSFKVRKCNDSIMEVFEITGFADILEIV